MITKALSHKEVHL